MKYFFLFICLCIYGCAQTKQYEVIHAIELEEVDVSRSFGSSN